MWNAANGHAKSGILQTGNDFHSGYNITMSQAGVMCWKPWNYVVTLWSGHFHDRHMWQWW